MEFGLLGPVEVRIAGQEADVGHARRRAVLAVLLLDLGRAVSPELLIDRVWGDSPPTSVRSVLYSYVAKLRQVIAGAADPDVQLARSPGGYILRARAGQLDLHRFRRLTADAPNAGGERAAAMLRQALGLWRGPALARLDSPWLRAMRGTLELERTTAMLDLNDVRLRLGQHAALVSELSGQAAASPASERLTGQLMLALYRSGRQAEALRLFEQTRQHLAGELGADPGPELRSLHQQILRADPSVAAPGPADPGPARIASPGPALAILGPACPAAAEPQRAVPRELPPAVPGFTGRSAELQALTRLLDRPGQHVSGAVVISAIGGTAGAGKTALAVHWAHQAADRFPDGQLYVNLRGYDPGQPVPAADALAGFLRSLGVPGQGIPPGAEQRAARYRTLLAGKRMLIVLDNARDEQQVRPLLPANPDCLVIITSRSRLTGLAVAQGAHMLSLGLFTEAEARELLTRHLGAERVRAEPTAVTELFALCAGLPLALAIAAAHAAARPSLPLGKLTAQMRDTPDTLDALETGDTATSLRAVFSWSYRHLDAEAARLFRLAGLHPGSDLELYAAAALTRATVPQARRALEVLARAHLIQPAAPGRYGMHDLLRAYASEQACATETRQQRAALTRLLDYYLAAAATAVDAMFPAEKHRRPQLPAPIMPNRPVPSPGGAQDWLNTERSNLVAIARYSSVSGWPGHTVLLAGILYRYLQAGGHFLDAQAIYAAALDAAQQTGDLAGQAESLKNLGTFDAWQGNYQQAKHKLCQALRLFRQAGDGLGQARTLNYLGIIGWRQGHAKQAVGQFRHSLVHYRKLGDRLGESGALTSLGLVLMRQGHDDQAAHHHRESLAISRDLGHRHGEAIALGNLGEVLCHQGHYQQAADHLSNALAIYRELGDPHGEADALQNLGRVLCKQTRFQQAAGLQRQSLAIFREIGDRAGETESLNSLGETLSAAGSPTLARAQHHQALTLATQIGAQHEQARAHAGLAQAYNTSSNHTQARLHRQQALDGYANLGMPHTADQP